MKQRVLAMVGALALIGIAVALRATVLGGDDQASGSGGGSRPTVACTPDLASVCEALAAAGTIAADPPTLDLDAATKPPKDLDGWITWDPAPGIADIDAPDTWGEPQAIGTAPLAVGVRQGSAPDLPSGCALGTLTWACVERAAQDGTAVGVGSPTTAEGLARLYPIAQALVPADGDFTTLSGASLRAVLTSPPDPQSAFPDQLVALQTRLGSLDLLVGPKDAVLATGSLTASEPTPPSSMTAVLVPVQGRELGGLAGRVTSGAGAEALGDLGISAGAGRLAPETRAGELYALREKVD